MTDVSPPGVTHRALPLPPTRRATIGGAFGGVVAAVAAATEPWQTVPLLGWATAALVWTGWTWLVVLRLDAEETDRFATREEPHRAATDLLLVGAAIASLVAVALGVVKASDVSGTDRFVLLGAGVVSIIASWGVVHTVFALRYAALYFAGGPGVIDFNQDEEPTYADFAYVAFTIGMTYQVSDTDLTTRAIRHTALRHALLSFLLGTVIIATTINLAAGLAG